MPRATLTPKQQRFVEEYLIDLNATQAAIRAGYSKRTANEQAARLLAKVSIQTVIAQAQHARAERTQITADQVLQGLWAEATFTGEGASHSARVSAWGLLAKHFGLLTDKVAFTDPSGAKPYAGALSQLSIDELLALRQALETASD